MQTLDQFSLSSDKLEGAGSYYKTGAGFPIVLLHGFAETHEIWNPIIQALAKKYTLIIPAIPACGNPVSFKEKFSMESIADYTHDILVQENIEKTILFGHSMGGYAAMAFAENFSPKLAGLSLVHSTAAADSAEKKEIRSKAIEHLSKNGHEHFFKTLIPKLYAKADKNIEDKKRHLEMALKYNSAQAIHCYRAMKERPDRKHVLSKLNVPIQLLGGQEDQSVPYQDLEKQAHLCKQAHLRIFPSVGHTPMHENTFQLVEAIIGFLDDILQTNEL